ncbi:MAG: heme exporter protein CcmB [Candidatus Hydrothermarchaeales archaeon]
MNFDLVIAIVKKDLKIEFRTKQTINLMFLFAFITLLMFSFTTEPFSTTLQDVGPGLLWFVLLFTGMLGLARAFIKEKEFGTLDGLRLTPISNEDLLAAKIIYNLFLVFLIEIIAFPIFLAIFNYPIKGNIILAILILTLGNIGFIIVGSFMSALVMEAKTKDMILQVIVFPLILPIVIFTILALRKVLIYGDGLNKIGEVKLMVVYIIIMATLSTLLFDYVLED